MGLTLSLVYNRVPIPIRRPCQHTTTLIQPPIQLVHQHCGLSRSQPFQNVPSHSKAFPTILNHSQMFSTISIKYHAIPMQVRLEGRVGLASKVNEAHDQGQSFVWPYRLMQHHFGSLSTYGHIHILLAYSCIIFWHLLTYSMNNAKPLSIMLGSVISTQDSPLC